MLTIKIARYYKVKKGQKVKDVAEAFCVAERAIIRENDLTEEPYEGQVLRIPTTRGNVFTACEGQSKALLCGSDKRYAEKNGTDILYPGMRVIL
ncbi:MAG: LysM peptidoglycan-binding domain-containing protein [Clostridia bacterium]|nr:LysM peptidoglycan-binding domain-containing protein [Clostridia bacterium]